MGVGPLVEKNELPNHPTLCRRQHAPDLESSQIAGARDYDPLQGFADWRSAYLRLEGQLPAHNLSPLPPTFWRNSRS